MKYEEIPFTHDELPVSLRLDARSTFLSLLALPTMKRGQKTYLPCAEEVNNILLGDYDVCFEVGGG